MLEGFYFRCLSLQWLLDNDSGYLSTENVSYYDWLIIRKKLDTVYKLTWSIVLLIVDFVFSNFCCHHGIRDVVIYASLSRFSQSTDTRMKVSLFPTFHSFFLHLLFLLLQKHDIVVKKKIKNKKLDRSQINENQRCDLIQLSIMISQ